MNPFRRLLILGLATWGFVAAAHAQTPTPLRVISFDGGMPTSRQMIWRSLGYLLSTGLCFLGFLCAVWDEDHLCWHDRISQTYVTPIEQIANGEITPPRSRSPEMRA